MLMADITGAMELVENQFIAIRITDNKFPVAAWPIARCGRRYHPSVQNRLIIAIDILDLNIEKYAASLGLGHRFGHKIRIGGISFVLKLDEHLAKHDAPEGLWAAMDHGKAKFFVDRQGINHTCHVEHEAIQGNGFHISSC